MYTLMHEHIHIDLSKVKKNDDCKLDCKEETIKEFKKLYDRGVRTIVDVTNIGMGRDIDYIKEVSEKTGIKILVSTGYYKEPFLPEEVTTKTPEQLAEVMIKEIRCGINGSGVCASVIGEVGSSNNVITELERKNLIAAAIAHKATGAPISTHTTLGTCALEQIKIFNEYGVDLSRVIIGHVDLSGDEGYIENLLKNGVNVEFDTIGKENYLPDSIRADILSSLVNKGWEDQIVLSMDITRKSHLEYKNGIGYSYIFDTFIPMLDKTGMKEGSVEKMLIENPKRILEIN